MTGEKSQVGQWWHQNHLQKPHVVQEPWLVQDKILEEVENLSGNDYIALLVNKGRQIGATTTMLMEVLYRLLHQQNAKVGITCLGSNPLQWLRPFLPPHLTQRSSVTRDKIELSNGSCARRIRSELDLHGLDLDLLWLDEAAWSWANECHPAESFCHAKKVVMVSTPAYDKGTFYDLFISGCHRTLTLPWWTRPDRDKKWYETQLQNLGPGIVAKDLDCLFT